MAEIRPLDLPAVPGGLVAPTSAIIVDDGTGVYRATPEQVSRTGAPFATTAEAQAGVVTDKYMSPARTAEAITFQVSAVVANKVDVSALASQAEAQAGTDNGKWMSPLRTSQAIATLSPVRSVAGRTGIITLTKADVGLGNVDNTSDAAKPISTATQAALDDKASKDIADATSNGLMSFIGFNKLAGIETGAQVNAVVSVAGKAGAVTLVKADVGLGNVDNTSDASKPISTSTQTALDAKAAGAVTITAESGLTGGGNLTANRSLALSSTSLASLALADSAVQPGTLGGVAYVNFPAVPAGNVLNDLGNWVPQSGGGGGGGGQVNTITQGTGIAVNATDPINPTVSLSSGPIASLALADSAVQPSALGDAAGLNVGTSAGTVAAGNHTHPAATTSVAGFMSGADKTKLNGVATGATANLGTVTSVGMSIPTGFSIGGSPVTASGTFALTYAAGYVGYTTVEASKLEGIAAGATANTGTVTSVNASGGSTGLSFTGGPITSSGTLTLTVASAGGFRVAIGLGTAATMAGPTGDIVGTTGMQTLAGKTLTAPIVNGYTEGVGTLTSTSFSPALTSTAVFNYTTNGNTTINLPTPVAGKSFSISLTYGGVHTLTWAGGARKWPDGEVPTPTSVSGKIDVFTFMCVDGTNWLAFASGQNL